MAAQKGGGRTVLAPKGERLKLLDGGGEDEVPVEVLRATLFSLPLPPPPTHTRTYPTVTALGRIMRLRGLSINETAKVPGGPSARQLGDALAERRELTAEHKDALAAHFGIDRRLLD